MSKPLNLRAHDLNRRLFELCYDLGNLALDARNTIDASDDRGWADVEALAAAVDSVKLAHTQLAQCELVIDAVRDEKDQSYRIPAAR